MVHRSATVRYDVLKLKRQKLLNIYKVNAGIVVARVVK